MPYRRLPNTDSARLKALKTALDKGRELPPFKLSFSQSSLRKLQSFLPQFEKAMIEYKNTYSFQVSKNKDYLNALKKVKLYISHFFQVLNMAISRGELHPSNRVYFGMEEDDSRVPNLNTEASVIEWGEKILKGEEERKMKNLSPITNPTAAIVKVRYEKFLEGFTFQKTIQKDNKRALDKITDLRKDADDIILNVWNEVEDALRELPEELKREKATEYGLVYVFRKNELKKISLMNAQLNIF